MKEQFSTQEIAIKLSKLGFNEKCLAYYLVFGDGIKRDGKYGQTEPELFISGVNECTIEEKSEELSMYAYHVVNVPLWQQVIDWLREKHKIWVNPVSSYEGIFFFIVADQSDLINIEVYEIRYNSYYESREKSILKAINLLEK